MKTVPRIFVFAGALAAAASVWGQAIQFVNVTRQANYVQTTDSSVNSGTLTAAATPFIFRAAIEGDNSVTGTSPIASATYTPPSGSPTALTYDSSGHRWTYEDSTQTSMTNLNAAYTTGSYAFNMVGDTGAHDGSASISVASFASTQLQIPLLTLSGGTWVGSTYRLNAGSVLTVAFNSVYSSTVSGTAAFHYDAELNGNGNQSVDDFIHYDPTANSGAGAAAAYASTPPNFVSSALSAGSYTFVASYDDLQNPGASGYASAFGASLLEYRTTVNISVIPEPAAEAELLGLLVLAGVMIRRRQPA